MDFFQRLPAEIRLLILENIYSHNTIWKLIRASPIMLKIHQQHKASLLRTYISKLVRAGNHEEGLIEDALAIIGFNDAKCNNSATKCHFDQWANKTLPDPFKKWEKAQIAKLDRLFARVGLFIEDYMSKATSPALAIGYLSLPKIVCTKTGNRVTLDDLTPTERYRLFRAFLRFETLCKVFDPRTADAMGADYQWERGIYNDEYLHDNTFPGSEYYWEIAHASWQTLDPWLYESLHCVWSYIQTCYGAIFAHVAWADKYPTFLTTEPRKKNLLYPDNMYINPDAYFYDLRMPESCIYRSH